MSVWVMVMMIIPATIPATIPVVITAIVRRVMFRARAVIGRHPVNVTSHWAIGMDGTCRTHWTVGAKSHTTGKSRVNIHARTTKVTAAETRARQ